MSASRRKGTAWESAIVDYLTANGATQTERRALCGTADRGDIAGIPGVVIEAKAEKAISLAEYVTEAECERINDGARIGLAWVKRRGKTSPGEAYVVMTGANLVRLLVDAGYIREPEVARPVVAPYLPAAATPEGIEDIALPGLEAACPSRYAAPTGAVVGCRQTGLHNVHSNLAAGGDRVAWMTGDLSEVAR